jgi:hypothetical protein
MKWKYKYTKIKAGIQEMLIISCSYSECYMIEMRRDIIPFLTVLFGIEMKNEKRKMKNEKSKKYSYICPSFW